MPLFPNGVIKLAFPDRDIQIGDTVPDFFRPSHDGKVFKLSQQNTPIAILCLGSIANPYALDKLKAIESGSVDLAGHRPIVLTSSGLREIRSVLDTSEDLKTIPYSILSDEGFSEEALWTFSTRKEDGSVAYNLIFLDANKVVTRIQDTAELLSDHPEYVPSAILDAAIPIMSREEYDRTREQQIEEATPPVPIAPQPSPVSIPGFVMNP
jgi:hypothetical protein